MPEWWERHFLRNEVLLAVVAAAATVIWSERFGGRSTLDAALHGSRAQLYGTVASIAGALLGFMITTLTILHSLLERPVFERIRASGQYPILWAVFRWTLRLLSVLTGGALVALVVDSDAQPTWPVFYLLLAVVLVTAVLVVRSIWILERVLRIDTKTVN